MNTTLNFGLFLFMFLLVKFNILLLNEETLILIVFCTFCILSVSKLGPIFSSFFQDQKNNIKVSISSSSSKLFQVFNQQKDMLNASSGWVTEFSNLKIQFLKSNSVILQNWPKFYQRHILSQVVKRLEFSKRLEQQVTKLISLIILEKTQKTLLTQKFCVKTFKLKKFLSSGKICLREQLVKI
uniref:ATP synthase F0 subunit b n=1 Tax=Campylaephora sungminbooi TaxID=1896769 RepID=UPI002E78CFF7|nr:ATP synthase F0 subunit b [Campylaephora sungminbooi]YP_011017805.1 ATP synthase F0 subunit b [Campylaephora sungminbooi]WQF69648.1 ATP synthase F0 subunit b [Campylaephora sungminbooi]WQF69651.1 ATP synthase F0 subunit b [Campylaephora sungminbooi]